MRTILTILLIIFFGSVKSQETILTLDNFIAQVRQFHPVSKQANILVSKAKADLQTAKGGFDPTVTFEASRKTLDDKNYYYYTNPEIKVPLPIGDIKTGIENNGGANMSSELTPGKSSYLGVDVPLLKGLIFDKRRATLQQAKVLVNFSEQERLVELNNLLFDAHIAYGNWATAYQLYNVYTNYVNVSSNRLKLVKISNKNGDRSVMDTVEALTQLQNFEMLQTAAALSLNNSIFELNNFLWQQNDSALQLKKGIIPQVEVLNNFNKANNVEATVANAMLQNPNIKMYDFKIDVLNIERKLKQQSLLPTLNAKANILNKDYAVLNGFNMPFIQNNYKWGIDFKFPIFMREAKGELAKTKFKIQENKLELNNKRVLVENKIRSYENEYSLLQDQYSIANKSLSNFNSLYKNENLRFNNGESSLFLVNSRENKVLEMQQKNIELQFKIFKAKYAVDWAAGLLR